MPRTIHLPLAAPPEVAAIGHGLHQPSEPGRYLLPTHWCLHAYRWSGSVSVEGHELEIRPRSLHLTPPNQVLVYRYQRDSRHLSVHFRLAAGGGLWPAAEMQRNHADFSAIEQQLEQALLTVRSRPGQTQAMLWSVLWQLVERGAGPVGTAVDPRFEAVCARIESKLGEGLSVPALAAEVELSHNQLTRLFHRHAQTTVVGYIRSRRMQRACHLLRHSTQSIGAIGAAVGLTDPHAFNKSFRRELGCSPRAYRAAAPGRVDVPV
jgi:AraC family transcriptional regulator